MAATLDTKKYLEYLDKEMSIMGILSAFSMIAPGGILSALLASDKGPANALWATSSPFIAAGATFCVIAALCFYRERSILAWHYGQICLAELIEEDATAKTRELLRGADSWASWWSYSWGFTFLDFGFIDFLLAIIIHLAPPHWAWCRDHLHTVKVVAFVVCPLAAIVIAALQWYALTRYRFSDHYWIDFWKDLGKWINRRRFRTSESSRDSNRR